MSHMMQQFDGCAHPLHHELFSELCTASIGRVTLPPSVTPSATPSASPVKQCEIGSNLLMVEITLGEKP